MKTKEIQGRLWSTAPQDWAVYLEPTFVPMYRAVLSKIGIDEKTVLLDAGCGSGLFLKMASRKGAQVYGVDASPGLLHLAKQRLTEGTFLLEDLEDLPFAENSFDVVTGFNSFQYAGDKIAALARAKRVVKKGGKIALGLWDEPGNCDASTVYSAVSSLLPPPPPTAAGPFALSTEGTLEKMCRDLQLTLLHKEKVCCPWIYASLDDLFKAFMCTGPAVRATELLGERKVKEVIVESAQPYCVVDEIYFIDNYFNYYILQK